MIGLLLNIVAVILFAALTPLNWIVCLFKYGVSNKYFTNSALELDKFGNRNFRTLFNLLLVKRMSYKFGIEGETISSVLGKNQADYTLTWVGWFVVAALYVVGYKYWGKGGHCLNSIDPTV